MRRLHDEYRYTTVYVTHDQSEAMTTADVIAVMNAGKIEQAGSPEDIYDRPRSEFVARFIGSSNVIKGQALDEATFECAGCDAALHRRQARRRRAKARSRCASTWCGCGRASPTPWRTCCREPWCGRFFSAPAATIWWRWPDGTQLRVVASAAENIPQGAAVWLYLPPERCRVLSG